MWVLIVQIINVLMMSYPPVLFEDLPDALAELDDVRVELAPLQAPRVRVRRLDLSLLLLYDLSQRPEKINFKDQLQCRDPLLN